MLEQRDADFEVGYPWRCVVCDMSNGAERSVCAQCGVPARATGRAIAQAKAGLADVVAAPVNLHASTSRARIAEVLAPLSRWRQVLAIVGGALAAAGGAGFKMTWSLAGMGWGALMLVVGLAVMAIALADREAPAIPGRRTE